MVQRLDGVEVMILKDKKQIIGKILGAIFWLSQLYYVFIIGLAIMNAIFGADFGWFTPDYKYGLDAAKETLLWAVVCTIYLLFPIPVYQVLYITCYLITKHIKKRK